VNTLLLPSPIGVIQITQQGDAITSICLTEASLTQQTQAHFPQTPLLERAAQELSEYFLGARRNFTFPLAPVGTPFQKRVWQTLLHIPCGQTCSYSELAQRIGNPRAWRAVGSAVGKNPILIAIPCHRVIAANGGIGGYREGLSVKRWLLKHESGMTDSTEK